MSSPTAPSVSSHSSSADSVHPRLRKLQVPLLLVVLLFTWPVVGMLVLLASPLLITMLIARLIYGVGEATKWKFLRMLKLAKFIVLHVIQQVSLVPTFINLAWYNYVTARGDKSVRFDVPFADYDDQHGGGENDANLVRGGGTNSPAPQSPPALEPAILSGGSSVNQQQQQGVAGGGGGLPPLSNSSFGSNSSFTSFTQDGLSRTNNKYIAHCRLDVLMHPDKDISKLRPVIVFVYGGTWSSGSKSYYTKTCDAIRRSCGAVVVVPDYPKWPDVTIPAMTDCLYHVLRWVHRNIGRYGGDSSSLHLFGHSAGGQIVTQLMMQRALALTCNHPLPLPRACFRRSRYHSHPVRLFSLSGKETVVDPAPDSSVAEQHTKRAGESPTEHLDFYRQQQEIERKLRAVSSELDFRRCPAIQSITLAGAANDLSYQLAFEHAWGGDRISTLESACRGYYTMNSPTLLLNTFPAPVVPVVREGSGSNTRDLITPEPEPSLLSSASSCETTPRTRELARLHVPEMLSTSSGGTGGFSPLNPIHLPQQICVIHGVQDRLVDLNQQLMFRDALWRQIGPQQMEQRFSFKQIQTDHIGLVLGPVSHSPLGGMHPVVAALAVTVHKASSPTPSPVTGTLMHE